MAAAELDDIFTLKEEMTALKDFLDGKDVFFKLNTLSFSPAAGVELFKSNSGSKKFFLFFFCWIDP